MYIWSYQVSGTELLEPLGFTVMRVMECFCYVSEAWKAPKGGAGQQRNQPCD